MRRYFVVVIALALLELALPSRAHAWWEFLEQLSGPGPFQGFDVQFRWPCFARTETTAANGDKAYKIERASAKALGAIVSLCKLKPNQTRWGAIDTGYRSLWTNGDVRFADNESIRLQTVGATFSYNIFNAHPEGDFVDVAAGGGKFWFTSDGLDDTVSGVFWEPFRIEFHPTTSFKKNVTWDQWIPVLRAGYLYFPDFAAAKFKARQDIESEFVLKIGVFWDFQVFR